MAHFALLWKARTIEKYRQNYENEKINSIIMSNSDVPDKTLFQRWRHYKHGMQKRLSRTFSKWYPEGSTVSHFLVSLRTDMKLPSILLRSLYGFIGGLLMTYLGFMFFVFQLSVSLMHATVLSSIVGVLLTLGLTFSNRMRCLIFLLIPQLFSRVGRYTLTCYALVLILTGPATNTLKNSEVLSESMACSQEQIKLNVKQINESIKKPFNSIKDPLKVTFERMNFVVRKLKTALIKTNKIILSIASIIQSGYSWLDSMVDVCNDALGSPHQKCIELLKKHCQIKEHHYNYNDIAPKNSKKFNKNIIRDILDAIGIKNVKQPRDFFLHVGDCKKNRDKTKLGVEDIKKLMDLREGNDRKRNGGQLSDAKDKDKTEKAHFNFGNFKKSRDTIKLKDVINMKDLKKHNGRKKDSKQLSSKEDEGKNYSKPWFCNVANVAGTVCASLHPNEKYCIAADFVGDTFLATIKKKLKTFVRRISTLIHVQLNIQHTYTFIGNRSSSNQIASGIVTEIRNRADPLLTWLSWSSCVTSLFLLLIIFRAKHYQHMFETRSRFDNRFITKEFRELDLKRLREGRETVLPLNTRERAKYVTTTSFRLVASEKLHLNRSAVFMTVATFKLLIHVVADYSLFWVLATIRHHGKMHTFLHTEIGDSGASISGTGFVARLLQAFLDTMNLQLWFPPPEHSCLPKPYPPDVKRYCQIGFLIFLLWFFALLEPYGLRVRHLIMGHYRPQRAKDRAVWLYNHVLRTRASFMKFARRKLHREYKYSPQSKLTLHQSLRTHILLRWISFLFGIKPSQPRCLLCNISEDTSDHHKELIKCEVPNCPGLYCPCCFSDIGQLCTICLSPSDYGDFSDVSLEKGSSDDSNSENDDDPEADNTSGSYKRKSNSDLADSYDDDGDYSKKSTFVKQRHVGYLLGNIKNNDRDTIPLLQYPTKHNAINNETQKNNYQPKNETKVKSVSTTTVFQFLDNNIKQQTKFQKWEYDTVAISKSFNIAHTGKIMSTMNILLYSLYKITKNPLHIKKMEYTTHIAKYFRIKKLVRRKKTTQRYSNYFMTCSNNNIANENIKNTSDNGRQENHTNNLRKSTNDENSNVSGIELKRYYNKNELDNVGFKNKISTSRVRKHKDELHTSFSKYWNNVNLTVSLENFKMKTKENLPPNKESKHKRKKKRKNTKNPTSKENKKHNINKQLEVSGNSRLFAFLDERDWLNCYDNVIDAAEREMVINNQESNEEKILVNNITIPKLNLSISSELAIEPQVQKINGQEISTKRSDGTRYFKIEKFFKSIDCSTCELFRNVTDLDCATDEFYYKEASESFFQTQDNERKSVRSTKSDANPTSFCNASSKTETGKERRFQLARTRISNSLLAIRNRCSSIIFRKIQEKNLVNKDADPDITDNVDCGLNSTSQTEVETVKNDTIQLKDYKQTEIVQNANIVEKVADRVEIKEKYDKEIQTTTMLPQKNDKEVTALPLMKSCGCQNVLCFEQTQDLAVQVTKHEKKCDCKDAKVMTLVPTCTCGAQYDNKERKEVATAISQRNYHDPKLEEEFDSDSSTIETSIFYTNDSKTDTTVCSYANVDCGKIYQRRRNCRIESRGDHDESTNELVWKPHYKIGRVNKQTTNKQSSSKNVRLVTKSNQSTLTDRTKQCDASTATYDWWSPLVERKNSSNNNSRPVEKRRTDCGQISLRERRTFRNRGMSTGDKIVTFRSKTQFIPCEREPFGDILSASRYLLESQRYYNELYYNIFASSPRVYPVSNFQKCNNLENNRSDISNNHKKRRGRKTKRLEESYSPRKDIQQSRWTRRFECNRCHEPSRRSKK